MKKAIPVGSAGHATYQTTTVLPCCLLLMLVQYPVLARGPGSVLYTLFLTAGLPLSSRFRFGFAAALQLVFVRSSVPGRVPALGLRRLGCGGVLGGGGGCVGRRCVLCCGLWYVVGIVVRVQVLSAGAF